MAMDDYEEGYNDVGFDDGPEAPPDQIRVRFSVVDGRAKGRVVTDVRGKARRKIVFPARGWLGAQPHDGEELSVQVVHETNPEDPGRGVLFVQRVLPLVGRGNYRGALYAGCTQCGRWEVRVFPRSGSRRDRYPVCESCGTMHELSQYWW